MTRLVKASLFVAVCVPFFAATAANGEWVANRLASNKLAANELVANRLASNRLASNRIALNRLASNRLASNRLAGNRLASNGLETTTLGDGAVIEVTAIVLPDGTVVEK
jgi:hypothetical protein